MKLVILNGSTCSGKSTILKNIIQQKDNYFQLSYDSIKWLFANYQPSKQYQDVLKVLLAIAETVLGLNYNIITDSVLHDSYKQKLISLAKKANYEILEINLEAEFDVLSQRFDERVVSALATPGRRISNLSKDRFIELFDIFQREKNTQAITIRTDTQDIDEVTKSVMDLLI